MALALALRRCAPFGSAAVALPRAGLALALALAFSQAAPLRAQAQDQTAPLAQANIPQSAILTVDTDFIFANSLYGVKIEQDFNAAAQVLIAENTQIETRLTTEEKELTDQRASLSLEEFRARAQAFDARVQNLRETQRIKETEVQAIRTKGRQTFQEVLSPVLAQIARERGASVMFERQQVFLSAESIDVTLEALDRVNEAFKQNQANDPDAPIIAPDTPQDVPPDAPEDAPQNTPQDPPQDAPQSNDADTPANGTQE
ncbi:MAG: OmpH family outer membrane protein [Paracoccaceae bacterium]